MDFFSFLVFLCKLLPHLFGSVGSDAVVSLGGDPGQLQLRALPPLLHLDGDAPVPVAPVLEDALLSLQLADLVEQAVSASGQHEVKKEIDLPPFSTGVLNCSDHLVIGRVRLQVCQGQLDAAVLEVVIGLDILGWQGHIQFG